MGVTFAQVGLLGHDVAHRQVFRTKKPSALVGRILANVGVAMSYGWWTDKHTRHHNNPNHDELDPDVQPELLIWATESAWGRRGVKGFVNRHQAGLFFTLLTLLSIDLRLIDSYRQALRHLHAVGAPLRAARRQRALPSRRFTSASLADPLAAPPAHCGPPGRSPAPRTRDPVVSRHRQTVR